MGASNSPKQLVQSLTDDSLRQDYQGSPEVPPTPYLLTSHPIRPEPKPYTGTQMTLMWRVVQIKAIMNQMMLS